MKKKLVVLRNERSTYEVHLETGDPLQKYVGGQSLDLACLKTELLQHGCSQGMVSQIVEDVESRGSTTVTL